MVRTWLPSILPFFVVAILIAGFGWLTAADIFKRRSTRFVLRVGLPIIVVVIVGGAFPLFKARHLDAERNAKLAFKAEHFVGWRDRETIETDFLAPTKDIYLVSLPDARSTLPSSPKNSYPVDCTVVSDGKEVPAVLYAIDSGNKAGESFPGLIIAQFQAAADKRYHVKLRIPPALALPTDQMVRVGFSYHRIALSEALIGIAIIGGIGESFWLAAYGVFVAAAIRIALNWREAADRRAFLTSQPPP